MKLQIQKLHPDAKIPTYAHETDAGLDLYSVAQIIIKPGERAQVPTGVAVGLPQGHVGLIWDKSGLSHKGGLKTLGGVVDSGYCGELLIGLVNTGKDAHTFAVGDKVAQLLVQKVEHPEIVEVDVLQGTDRGVSGFGSTGK